jgi:hypothetical protein
MVTRLRLDARLFDPPQPRRSGAVGRPRVTGCRQPTLAQRLANSKTRWRRLQVSGWYGRGERLLEIVSGTDLDADLTDILRWFVRRWSMEVTFAEARRHLGVEIQRQWSDLAIARTTPALLGLFSLITLWAHGLSAKTRPTPRAASWYPKLLPTFSDAIAAVRREL